MVEIILAIVGGICVAAFLVFLGLCFVAGWFYQREMRGQHKK